MIDWLIILPALLPIITAALCFYFARRPRMVTTIAWLSSALNLAVSVALLRVVIVDGTQALNVGGWVAPFGITFVADLLGAMMAVITCVIGLAIVIYATADLRDKPSYCRYHMLTQFLLAGVCGAFLTGDIFNLYVWFEVMLISTFGLMILDADKQQVDGTVKYVVLNMLSTMMILLAIGLLFGATGTLNMADLHLKTPMVPAATTMLIAALFLFSFSIKSALFPVFSWLPASYHTLPSAVVALFAALLTKVGVYVLIRLFTLIFPLDASGFQFPLIIVAGLTMLTGVLGAASQFGIKRILSFHIISQIGYMIMGLALYTPLALAGAIFYIVHHIIVKCNLFLIGGYLSRRHGGDHLKKLGGTYQNLPLLAFLFIIPAFSLAGFPPLSGFWGKFLVIKASLQTEQYLLAGTALFVGLLTIYSMTKIWAEAFWKESPEEQSTATITLAERFCYYTPIVLLAMMTVVIGLSVEPLFQLCERAANEALSPESYLRATLGEWDR